MSFIKIKNLLINLDQIETVEFGNPPMLEVPADQVTITLVGGRKLTFEREEAGQLRAFFARSSDVHNVMEVSEPLEMLNLGLPDLDLSEPNSANLSIATPYSYMFS